MDTSLPVDTVGLPSPSGVITRRRLLQASGLALAATAATQIPRGLPGVLGAVGASSGLTRSNFAGVVGERVRLTAPDGRSIGARLDRIADFPGSNLRALRGSEDAFILLFHGPISPRLPQDVLRVSHPRLGRVELLVSPAGTGRRGQDYAAVINRARAPRHRGDTYV